MRILFMTVLFLSLPAIGFSQGTMQLVDNEYRFVPLEWQPENADTLQSAPPGGDAVDIVGGTNYVAYNGVGLAKGNAYRVDIDVVLTQAEFWLEFTNTQTLRFYVFESPVEFGTYSKIFETSNSITGTGEGWYSSGSISVSLPKDNYYLIAVSWDGSMNYWFNAGDMETTSFGAHVHAYATGLDPLGSTLYSGVNDQAIYHQRLTTEEPSLDPLSVTPGTVSAWFGGEAYFKLNAGPDYANYDYALLAGFTGSSPGTTLPNGNTLPLNFDWFTYEVLSLALAGNPLVTGFMGTLDADGYAEAVMTLTGHCQLYQDLIMTLAFTTVKPYDFQSNYVELLVTGVP